MIVGIQQMKIDFFAKACLAPRVNFDALITVAYLLDGFAMEIAIVEEEKTSLQVHVLSEIILALLRCLNVIQAVA